MSLPNPPQPVPTASLVKRVLAGAGMALALGAGACVAARAAAPEAGAMPRVATTLALAGIGGAVGGVVFHYLEPLRQQGRAWRIAADVAGVLGYGVIVAVACALAFSAAR